MIPKLGMVKLSDIKPLMESDERKTQVIVDTIEELNSIRNPFILASTGEKDYFLLEDSSVLKAADHLKFEYIPAQIVPFSDDLSFSAFIHIDCMKRSYLDDFLAMFPRAFILSTEDKNGAHLNDGILASIDIADQPVIIISFRRGAEDSIQPSFFDFFKYLNSKCSLMDRSFPVSFKTNNLREYSKNCQISILNLSSQDIHSALLRGYLFPEELLKFDFGCRILGINYPVNVLKAKADVEEKEEFLKDLVNLRLKSGYSKYIKNGVYLLNY